MKLILMLIVLVACIMYAAARISINENHQFVDEIGRTMIYRGMNAVYKIAPWLPSSKGFDHTTTLSRIDARNLQRWGFNVVRLGVMWPGVEPGDEGTYSEDYLDEVEHIVKILAEHQIEVVLDLHQDLFSRKFCGEGVPDYVVNKCKNHASSNMQAFPYPVTTTKHATNTTEITYDSDGNPSLDWCLQTPFFQYYMSEEISSMFQCVYDNQDGLWDSLGNFWKKVASRFSHTENVLGYELINEPWLGDIYNDKSLLLPGNTEKKHLAPMYDHIALSIREVDNNKIIFFEGVTIDYWPSGFETVPGGDEYKSKSVLAYHIYCPLTEPSLGGLLACRGIDKEYMLQRQKDADRLGSGLMMTEFGAMLSKVGDMQEMEDLMQMVDSFGASWMYWQFKQYEDLTTITPAGESLYSGVGNTLSHQKLRHLSRTYPQATAGELNSFSFNAHTAVFEMNYIPVINEFKKWTTLYFNRNEHYHTGIKLSLFSEDESGNKVQLPYKNQVGDLTVSVLEVWRCDDNKLDLIYTGNVDKAITVSLEPCDSNVEAICKCTDVNNDD